MHEITRYEAKIIGHGVDDFCQTYEQGIWQWSQRRSQNPVIKVAGGKQRRLWYYLEYPSSIPSKQENNNGRS